MPTREQVRGLLDSGLDYDAAGRQLGIPPGQAYLIATGVAADGSDTITEDEAKRPGFLPSSQQLVNPPHENPATKERVSAWLKARVETDEQMRTAMRERTAEPPEVETDEDEHPDAITVLGRQHSQVRYLLKELQALPSHTTGASVDQLRARKSIVDMITVRLSAHETIEEKHFWPTVREALPHGDSYADQALQQEREGNDTLTELGGLDPGTREFDERVEQLVAQVRKHVAFEELVFLKMRDEVRRDDLERLGAKLRDAARDRPAKRKGKGGAA